MDSLPAKAETPLIAKYLERFEANTSREPVPFDDAMELFNAYRNLTRRLERIARISDGYQAESKSLVAALQEALTNVKTLSGFIPVCASCKKIRNDDGYWKQLEQYLLEYSDALLSHSLCPTCAANYLALDGIRPRTHPGGIPDPVPALEGTDLDDAVVVEYLPIINNRDYTSSPLYGDLRLLFGKYVRLSRRLRRLARISDLYQSQLREGHEQNAEGGSPTPGGHEHLAPLLQELDTLLQEDTPEEPDRLGRAREMLGALAQALDVRLKPSP